jgi:hypothetical protein
VKNKIRDGRAITGVSNLLCDRCRYAAVYKEDVSQYGKQMLTDTLNHDAINEGTGGGVAQIQLDAAFTMNDVYVEIGVTFQQRLAVIELAARTQNCQRTIPKNRIQPCVTMVEKTGDFIAGQNVQPALRRDQTVNHRVLHGHVFIISEEKFILALNTKLQSGNGPMIPKVIKIDFYQAHPCTIAGKSIGIFFIFL